MLALIQAVFHIGDRFWARENRCPKNLKNFFFQDRFYLLKAHVHYFSVLIYLPTGRAAKRGILLVLRLQAYPDVAKASTH